MPKEPEQYASQIKYCPGDGRTICGSSNVKFKYSNNGKPDQPRYQCLDCKTMFSLGDHRRKKPGHYTKERNKDPEEFRGLHIKCSRCGAANQSRFKYYNNNCPTQPRFQCLSCTKQFQMRFSRNTLVAVKSNLSKSKPPKTKPARTKRGKRAPRSTKATTFACEHDVVNTDDQAVFGASESVPMEPSDGGEYFNSVGMEAIVEIPFDSQSDWTASASDEYDVKANVGQSDQSFYTDHQAYSEALAAPMDENDIGRYSSAYGYDALYEQVPVDQFSNTYHVPVDQNEYVGPYSSAYDYDVRNGEQVRVDQLSNAYSVPVQQSDVGQYYHTEETMMAAEAVPLQIPNYHSASAYEYEEVNAEQVEQLSNTDHAVPVNQSDAAECPYSVEMAAATANDDVMSYLEDFEVDQFRHVEDAVSLWD